jgi:hypothetical protein
MKNLILLYILIITYGNLSSQSVIASGGQSGSSSELQASATIGESIIGAQNNGILFSNQGFQQPLQSDITSIIEVNSKLKIEFKVGPIPSYNNIAFSLEKSLEGTFVLVDQLGKKIKEIPIIKYHLFYNMDLSQLDAATYYLIVISKENKKLTSVPIVKI